MRSLHVCASIKHMALEVRQMRHVIALAEHGSFARAATALGLSQSALSRSIQSVEREIGSDLFVRTAGGAEPTDSGLMFITRIRQIMQLTDDLDRDLVSERGLQSGYLHVGAGPYPAHSMFADALARFFADYPRVVVRVIMRDWDELLRRLRAREIEFFVAESSTFGGETDIEIESLHTHAMMIVARRGHPLASRAPISFSDGFAYPFVSVSRIPPRILEPIRAAQRRLTVGAEANRVFPALEFNSIDAIRRIVFGSDALVVVPPTCILEDLESGRLVALGTEPYLSLRYGIVKLKTQPLSAAGTRFREYVRESEERLAADEPALLEKWRPRAQATSHAAVRPRAAPGPARPRRP
jgi:DNA-binding transcriptional LysR family regulator